MNEYESFLTFYGAFAFCVAAFVTTAFLGPLSLGVLGIVLGVHSGFVIVLYYRYTRGNRKTGFEVDPEQAEIEYCIGDDDEP